MQNKKTFEREKQRERAAARHAAGHAGGRVSQTPGAQTSQTPGAQGSQTPGTQSSQTPKTQGSQTPGAQGSQTPGTQSSQTPKTQANQPPKIQADQTPKTRVGHPQKTRRSRTTIALLLCTLFLFGLCLLFRSCAAPTGCRQSDLTTVPDTSFAITAADAAGGAPGGSESGTAESAAPTRLVCLTFDDGPSKTTEAVLEVLKSEGVPATFFVIADGNNQEYLPLLRREADEGHEIALHSASHSYKQIYQNPESYWQDIKQLRGVLSEYVDVSTIHTLRFPGGSTNTVSRKYGGSAIMKRLKAQAKARGYRYVDWNVCADDAVGGHPSAEKVFRNTIADVGDKTVCVVLMHDTGATKTTAAALPDIIAWFREKGFAFATVHQLPAE